MRPACAAGRSTTLPYTSPTAPLLVPYSGALSDDLAASDGAAGARVAKLPFRPRTWQETVLPLRVRSRVVTSLPSMRGTEAVPAMLKCPRSFSPDAPVEAIAPAAANVPSGLGVACP